MAIHGDYLRRPTYQILHTIGEGAAGVCRVARHDVFDRLVVQKTISMLGLPDGVAREPSLLREARHAHLIEVWDAQWEKDEQYRGLEAVTFVCPYYPAGSVLDALSAGERFGLGPALAVCGDVLDALAYLHNDRQYLHRDVKPANILLTDDEAGGVLADLGSAGRLDASTGTAANYGGTRLYLDPQARPSGVVSARSDLYSLGMVAVEMISGRFPYESIDLDAVDRRLDQGKRALSDKHYALPPHVPPVVARLLRALTHPDQARRPTSAHEALRRLHALRYLDWREAGGGDDQDGTQEWVGTWPPEKPLDRRREYRVSRMPIASGGHAGQDKLSASSRAPGKKSRGLKRLTTYVAAGDHRALAAFFRSVEAEAQASPT